MYVITSEDLRKVLRVLKSDEIDDGEEWLMWLICEGVSLLEELVEKREFILKLVGTLSLLDQKGRWYDVSEDRWSCRWCGVGSEKDSDPVIHLDHCPYAILNDLT